MRSLCAAAGLVAIVLGMSACDSSTTASPMPPANAPAPPADAIMINIIAMNGGQSFSPDPSTVPFGKKVVWHNLDSVTHRVVFDDGEVDTGNIAPGAFSVPTGLVATGSYHCSIHPSMIGRTEDGQ